MLVMRSNIMTSILLLLRFLHDSTHHLY